MQEAAQCGLLSFDLAVLCLRVTGDVFFIMGGNQSTHQIFPHRAVQTTKAKEQKYLQMQMRHGVEPLFPDSG